MQLLKCRYRCWRISCYIFYNPRKKKKKRYIKPIYIVVTSDCAFGQKKKDTWQYKIILRSWNASWNHIKPLQALLDIYHQSQTLNLPRRRASSLSNTFVKLTTSCYLPASLSSQWNVCPRMSSIFHFWWLSVSLLVATRIL